MWYFVDYILVNASCEALSRSSVVGITSALALSVKTHLASLGKAQHQKPSNLHRSAFNSPFLSLKGITLRD